MNMTVDLDTDPIYEDSTTEKAVVVVLPLNALISDQMEHWKSLKSGNSAVYTSHEQCFVNNFWRLFIKAWDTIQTVLEST